MRVEFQTHPLCIKDSYYTKLDIITKVAIFIYYGIF